MKPFIKLPNILIAISLLLALTASPFGVTPAYAASIVVNSDADTVADDGLCTLREAITAANSDTASGVSAGECAAGGGADTIFFAADYTITLVGSQLPTITSEITINGNGMAQTIIQANAAANTATYRVFVNTGTLTLNNLTVRNGVSITNGGGIYNNGALTITNVTFSGNSAINGGGIYNATGSTLTMTGSTVSGNTATLGQGGGIYNLGTLKITSSTLSGNQVSSGGGAGTGGGGIYNNNILTITNSTLSANIVDISIPNDGGGIFNDTSGTLTMTNSTFSGNRGFAAGGLSNSGTASLINTIIANSISTGGVNDCIDNGTITTNTNNLIENSAYCSSTYTGDPNLGPLANNGGPTQTHALLAGSIAIDTGTNTGCPATDQRGITRPQGAGCDIGAYEVDTYPTVISTSLQPNYTTGPTSFTVTFSENVSNAGGGAGANDAENPANYILVEEGSAAGFQTTACNNTDFVQDTQILVNSVNYSPNTATVNLSVTPPYGSYRLFVCGTTSITNIAGNELNNGVSDYTFDFTVAPVAAVSSLPDTGFAPSRITSLPAQSTHYASLGSIWLEIPKLGVKSEIVGVPQSSNGWNVDWLGNSIGWLNGTAFPSWEGNSVITGHVYDANGLPGPFQKIKNLKSGDQVIVHMFGEKYIFEVRESEMVTPKKTSYALQHLEDHSYLTLITCQWYNPITDSYAFRRVVRAVLIKVEGE